MSDLLQRLRGYNPPDRTIEEQRQISVDIYEAAERIEALEAELERAKTDRDEFKQCFNDALALAQTNFEKFTAAEAELERVGQDARRWGVVLACARIDVDGGWVVHEDDPHNANDVKEMFTIAIDKARRPDEPEPEGASQDTPQP
jgi:hypothetical protein